MNIHTAEYNSHDNNYKIGSHTHNYYEIVFYITGNGVIKINNIDYPFTSNSFSICPPGKKHEEIGIGGTSLAYIGFSLDKNYDIESIKQGVFQCPKDDHILLLMKEILFEFQNKKFFYKEQSELLLNCFLNLIKRVIMNKTKKSEELVNIKKYIIENCNKGLNAKMIADKFHYNYDYFRKEFKKYFHVSISDMILNEQVDYATNLIRTTNLKIIEIAEKSGFSSTSHFISCFKKVYKVTPKKYIIKDLKG